MHLVVDTDTAGDDVIALLIALNTPWVQLHGITINCGNVAFDYQVENALTTVEVAGRSGEVPVYPGARVPLMREWVSADYVHGKDGMGESYFSPAKQRPEAEHAVSFLLRMARQYAGDLVIVAQAPLTNLALAVRQDAEFARRVKELWVMGGSVSGMGNVEPLSEYNFYVDPEAAAIVFGAGFNLYMVGWDVSLEAAVLTEAELAQIATLNTPLSRFFMATQRKVLEFNRAHNIYGTTHPDALTMALALDRRLWLEGSDYAVAIETRGEFTRGTSVVDRLGVWRRQPNAHVVTAADREGFQALLMRLLAEGTSGLPAPA
ncbi:MAG: nucleoside hydrolase [Firmicutes bacterium]|nr:nucleoside hydrolase [Bacillota bacterium]